MLTSGLRDSTNIWVDHGDNDEMIESFLNSIRTTRIYLLELHESPVDEEFGHRVAQALASNAQSRKIDLTLRFGGTFIYSWGSANSNARSFHETSEDRCV
jgi:hypothetical protein